MSATCTPTFLEFTSYRNIPMIARLVRQGERYGLGGCLLYKEREPVVEFFDARYDHNDWLGFIGQFISRYRVSTFLSGCNPLYLQGNIADWSIDELDRTRVRRWLLSELNSTQP